MVFITEGFFEVAIEIWLSYQAMSSIHTQSQLCTAAPVSSFVQCQISFRLLPSSVARFISIDIFLR